MSAKRSLKLLWLGILLLCVTATLLITYLVLPDDWRGTNIDLVLLAIVLAEVISFGWPILLIGNNYADNSPRLPFNLGFAAIIAIYDLTTLILVLSTMFMPIFVLKIGLIFNIAFICAMFLFFKIAQPIEENHHEA